MWKAETCVRSEAYLFGKGLALDLLVSQRCLKKSTDHHYIESTVEIGFNLLGEM